MITSVRELFRETSEGPVQAISVNAVGRPPHWVVDFRLPDFNGTVSVETGCPVLSYYRLRLAVAVFRRWGVAWLLPDCIQVDRSELDRVNERLASEIARPSLPPDFVGTDEHGRPWRGNPT